LAYFNDRRRALLGQSGTTRNW